MWFTLCATVTFFVCVPLALVSFRLFYIGIQQLNWLMILGGPACFAIAVAIFVHLFNYCTSKEELGRF